MKSLKKMMITLMVLTGVTTQANHNFEVSEQIISSYRSAQVTNVSGNAVTISLSFISYATCNLTSFSSFAEVTTNKLNLFQVRKNNPPVTLPDGRIVERVCPAIVMYDRQIVEFKIYFTNSQSEILLDLNESSHNGYSQLKISREPYLRNIVSAKLL